MSEAQPATPEQEARMAMNEAISQAQRQAYEDVQKNAQIELQMRGNSLGLAVNANTPGTDPATITKAAAVFLEFLKKGEA
jgi:hypothetical protein